MDARVEVTLAGEAHSAGHVGGGYVTRMSGAHRQASFDQVQLNCAVLLLLVTLDSIWTGGDTRPI